HTSDGKTSEAPGTRSTSSKVNARGKSWSCMQASRDKKFIIGLLLTCIIYRLKLQAIIDHYLIIYLILYAQAQDIRNDNVIDGFF
ncbi:MAG: hypothetical protein ACJARD_001689, partial [Alphaproteobacteria bacterium]